MSETRSAGETGQKQPGRPCRIFDRARAGELHDLGWPLRDIAAAMEVSTMTVQRALKGRVPRLPLLRNVPAIGEEPGVQPMQPANPEDE